ncbi:tetratricopeptide (TPR) repeat protein [Anaerosolibacter carboniphilus]|uniref:Tetratricopeptide (TPR) repeat protein n=1 Tax=Anaerosolibacter carboniphilus TaxID=1417629 RepID=A0A841L5I1_9FIRM|nr:stalk domain-containing protein [Anaerosolibacter carboniphilus]MBB6217669.1 tetratricopeptide (TPR) repeat protein [Anaerosolibacter carboniphilus]
MKKKLVAMMTLIFMFSLFVPAYGEGATGSNISVQLNGQFLNLSESPIVIEGSTFVPIRDIAEALGASVQWKKDTKTIIVTEDTSSLSLTINTTNVILNKDGKISEITAQAPPFIKGDKTYVPLRLISEAFNALVDWDQEAKTVVIIDGDYFLEQLHTKAPIFYEFAMKKYATMNTGEVEALYNMYLKFTDLPYEEDIDLSAKADIKGQLSENSGALDALIHLQGMLGSDIDLKDYENISFNLKFDNENIYVKSSLFKKAEEYGYSIGDKWLSFDYDELDIPNVTSYQDLKDLQNQNQTLNLTALYKTGNINLNVNTFHEMNVIFESFIKLVDSDNFKLKQTKGSTKVYEYSLNKNDILGFIVSLSSLSDKEISFNLSELMELKEIESLFRFDLKSETTIQNDVLVGESLYLDMNFVNPQDGSSFSLKIDGNTNRRNVNGIQPPIQMPGKDEVISRSSYQYVDNNDLSTFTDSDTSDIENAFYSYYDEEYEDALEFIDEALAVDPTDDYAHYIKAMILVKLDRDQEAIQSLDKAIQLNPENIEYIKIDEAFDDIRNLEEFQKMLQ